MLNMSWNKWNPEYIEYLVNQEYVTRRESESLIVALEREVQES